MGCNKIYDSYSKFEVYLHVLESKIRLMEIIDERRGMIFDNYHQVPLKICL